MDSNLYKKTPVQVQKKSGFDKSFQNLYTAKPGQLIPILSDEVIPNTTIHLNAAITAQLLKFMGRTQMIFSRLMVWTTLLRGSLFPLKKKILLLMSF